MSESITLKDKLVTIKKEHLCSSCYRKFPSKTKMWYWAGLTEGDFEALYMCKSCRILYYLQTEDYAPFDSYFIEIRDNKEQTPEQLVNKLQGE